MNPIDLTLTISKDMPTFPGSPDPEFVPWSEIGEDGYNMELLFMSSHTGTHLDAPYHFARDGLKIHQIPLERLVGRATLINLKKKKNSAVTKSDIVTFERKNGKISTRAVFFFTGWQRRLKHPDYFTENPGLDASATRHLALKGIDMVGIDGPSIDLGKSRSFPAHHALARKNILIVENLANLGEVETKEFEFAILPLKLEGATGSPVRALGFELDQW